MRNIWPFFAEHPPNRQKYEGFRDKRDTHGHLAGDSALRRLAGILSEQQRGDEFAILFPATTGEQAQERVMAIREALASPASFTMPGGDLPLPGISIGLATFGTDADAAPELVACADSRMYAQKAQMRALQV